MENFAHFVYDNIDNDINMVKRIIETRIPMKEIINKGIKYKNYKMKKLKKSNSMPLFNYYKNYFFIYILFETIRFRDNNIDIIEPNYLMKKMNILINNFSFLKWKK